MSFESIEEPDDCGCGRMTRGEIWFLSTCAVIIAALVVMGVFL